MSSYSRGSSLTNVLTDRDKNIGGDSDFNSLTYDAAGNLTDNIESYEYIYDAWNRLVEVEDQGSTTVSDPPTRQNRPQKRGNTALARSIVASAFDEKTRASRFRNRPGSRSVLTLFETSQASRRDTKRSF